MPRRKEPPGPDLFETASPTQAKLTLEEYALDNGLAASSVAIPSRYEKADGTARFVSQKSLAAYRRRGLYLLNEYLSSIGAPSSDRADSWPDVLPDPDEWAHWLLSERRPHLSPPSWRLYRRCACEILRLWPDDHPDLTKLQKQIGESEGEATKNRQKKRSERKTSAKRAREIKPADLFSLLVYLDQNDGRLNAHIAPLRGRSRETRFLPGDTLQRALSDWLLAGVATGLRPSEWRQSLLSYAPRGGMRNSHESRELVGAEMFWSGLERVSPDRVLAAWGMAEEMGKRGRLHQDLPGILWLVTYNAKHSNGRGNDDTRSLNLSSTPSVIRQAVLRMVLRGVWHHAEGDWERLQASVVRRLNELQHRLFPGRASRINLYSCRHQAFANFKSKTPLFNVAVIAGHSDPKSPDHFYSRAFRAWREDWGDILEKARSGDETAIGEVGNLVVFLRDKRRRGRRGKGGNGYRPNADVLAACIRGVAAITALQAAPPPGGLPAEARLLAERHAARLAARSDPKHKAEFPFQRKVVQAPSGMEPT